jgi:hypothetical protein
VIIERPFRRRRRSGFPAQIKIASRCIGPVDYGLDDLRSRYARCPQPTYETRSHTMAYYQAAPPPAAEDPNRTLTIVGFVLAFLCSLAGLIISIISYNRSKAVGYKNNLALAGIIISSVLIVLGILANLTGMTSAMYGR